MTLGKDAVRPPANRELKFESFRAESESTLGYADHMRGLHHSLSRMCFSVQMEGSSKDCTITTECATSLKGGVGSLDKGPKDAKWEWSSSSDKSSYHDEAGVRNAGCIAVNIACY